jgi:hypothetical protein
MDESITVKPLPYRTRQRTFTLLLALFLLALPFLYLYATGYRLDFRKPTTLISTGGIYLAVERTGAEIYIDDALVRETRTFRKAFYAQNIDVGTHRVHVQKEGYHTWVKELPVSKHLVTEAEAFNLPLTPQVRVIAPWQTGTGIAVVRTPLPFASTTNEIRMATTTIPGTVQNPEFSALAAHFGTTTATTTAVRAVTDATTTALFLEATTTVRTDGVELARVGDDLYATWVDSFERMPYYYCAAEFARYSTSTATSALTEAMVPEAHTNTEEEDEAGDMLMHPIQTVAPDAACTPTIRIDRKGKEVRDFGFYPGTADLVLVALSDGIYAVEIDARAWQNVQPVLLGQNLTMHLENGNLYVYDGHLIYQVFLNMDV